MTDTTINDALVFPQDEGSGVSDGSEDYSSAAYFSALSKYQGYGSYVGEDNTGSATLQFNDVDTTNEQVDVGTGYAYIEEGSHTVQSGSQTSYDTTIPINTPYVVMLPSEVVDLGLGTDNVNDLWLAVDPTSNDDVFIRHGNGLSAPSNPSVKLGTVDTSNGDTTRANDLSTTSNKSVSTEEITSAQNGYVKLGPNTYLVTTDAGFDAARNDVTDGGQLVLDSSLDIDSDKTLSTNMTLRGPNSVRGATPEAVITGTTTITCDSRVLFDNMPLSADVTVEVNADNSGFFNVVNGALNVNANGARAVGLIGTDVTFASGTSAGIVDASTAASVTDNGSNTVGDIA